MFNLLCAIERIQFQNNFRVNFHSWVNNFIIQRILKSAFLQTQVLMTQQSDDNNKKASDKRRSGALISIISEALHSLARATHAILLEL